MQLSLAIEGVFGGVLRRRDSLPKLSLRSAGGKLQAATLMRCHWGPAGDFDCHPACRRLAHSRHVPERFVMPVLCIVCGSSITTASMCQQVILELSLSFGCHDIAAI